MVPWKTESVFMRKIMEKLVRNKIIKRRLKYKGVSMPIYVSPDSQLKYLKINFEHELIRTAFDKVNIGDTVFDIGANCGVFGFSALLAGAAKVVFFEPDFLMLQCLLKTISVNELQDKAMIVSSAVSDKNGIQEFEVAERGRASNSLKGFGYHSKGGARQTIHVNVTKLDTYIEDFQPNFIKIDVEGAEKNVVQGALQSIKRHSPNFLIELCDEDKNLIVNIFEGLDYRVTNAWDNNCFFMK